MGRSRSTANVAVQITSFIPSALHPLDHSGKTYQTSVCVLDCGVGACRFGEEVAELLHCTSLDVYARLPSAAALLTPSTPYAAYLVYGAAEECRRLSFPDQEAALAVGGREVAPPTVREDGWWEVEMGRLCGDEVDVVASFEVLGWYPKRGLVLESVEFRPLHAT
jgi:hypothetical protein